MPPGSLGPPWLRRDSWTLGPCGGLEGGSQPIFLIFRLFAPFWDFGCPGPVGPGLPRGLPGASQGTPSILPGLHPGASQEPPRFQGPSSLPGASQGPRRGLPGVSQGPPRRLCFRVWSFGTLVRGTPEHTQTPPDRQNYAFVAVFA